MHGLLDFALARLIAEVAVLLLSVPATLALPAPEEDPRHIQISMLDAFGGTGYLIPHFGRTPIGCINSKGIWVNDGKPCDAFTWLASPGGYALVNSAGEYCHLSETTRAFTCNGWEPVLSVAYHGRLLGDDDSNLFHAGYAAIPDVVGSRVIFSGTQHNAVHVTLAWQKI